jgi:hypothetical protein
MLYFVAILPQITAIITVLLKGCGFLIFSNNLLVALGINHLLMPVALTLPKFLRQ